MKFMEIVARRIGACVHQAAPSPRVQRPPQDAKPFTGWILHAR